jgi:methylmalonyl-CoA mutase, N-terminal domain
MSKQKMSKEEEEIKTDSGFLVKPVYSRNNIAKRNITDETPGKYPFTRGIHNMMYRQRLWTMRQYSGFGSAEETNNRFKFLLDHGQTGLSLAHLIYQLKQAEIQTIYNLKARLDEPV